jgi:hypothetical protein
MSIGNHKVSSDIRSLKDGFNNGTYGRKDTGKA